MSRVSVSVRYHVRVSDNTRTPCPIQHTMTSSFSLRPRASIGIFSNTMRWFLPAPEVSIQNQYCPARPPAPPSSSPIHRVCHWSRTLRRRRSCSPILFEYPRPSRVGMLRCACTRVISISSSSSPKGQNKMTLTNQRARPDQHPPSISIR